MARYATPGQKAAAAHSEAAALACETTWICLVPWLLYFFHGRNVAILAHALTKEAEVPDIDIERAGARKKAVEHDPETHTTEEELA
jgi:hypothetical protein